MAEGLINPECQTKVTQLPKEQGDTFEVIVSCFEPDNEYTGGGEYLSIQIHGQYFFETNGSKTGSVDVQKIEINRAG